MNKNSSNSNRNLDPLTGMSVSGTQNYTNTLNSDEIDGLIYMREEEKLAHDVYETLYQEWGLNIFQNIADSEQRHTDSVAKLLDRYNLEDPATDNGIGVFKDPYLQKHYDTLVAQGSNSTIDALNVGILIEETDIEDLQIRIGTTDNADIEKVYSNLLEGSHNHLSAFESVIDNFDSTSNTSTF